MMRAMTGMLEWVFVLFVAAVVGCPSLEQIRNSARRNFVLLSRQQLRSPPPMVLLLQLLVFERKTGFSDSEAA